MLQCGCKGASEAPAVTLMLASLQWGPASPAEVRAVRQEYERERKHRAEQASLLRCSLLAAH